MPSSYISVSQASAKWGITERRIQVLCREGRIDSAIRVGKVWMIPENTQKPNDARLKKVESNDSINALKIRSLIKRTVIQLFNNNKTANSFLTMQQTISYFASFLLRIYRNKDQHNIGSEELAFVENTMKRIYPDYERIPEDYVTQVIDKQFYIFEQNKELLTDSLSWAYQYLKQNCPNELSSTQFFTEKYMISTLVNLESIKFEDNVLDPSCGSGNFLMYIYEQKLSNFFLNNKSCSVKNLNSILATLRGYDLDGFLSLISHFNLVITTVSVSSNHNFILDMADLSNLRTNVFASVVNNLEGFLNKNEAEIFNICTNERILLSKLMVDVDYIFTNPPFETIKGMNVELKDYLKREYPLCKCDLCVAFFLRIVDSMPPGARCGLVLQNSWMYLKSFDCVRKVICDHVALNRVIVLGSGAFTDISGEKASVSLVNFSKSYNINNLTSYADLSSYKRNQKESLLTSNVCNCKEILQSSLFGKNGSIQNDIIDKLVKENVDYSKYAVPMQGTSTGDSKRLIDYYWRHLGNPDWKPVSKGGGYSRWYGLNHYVLHWGSNGEFIKETTGSALRNVKYFNETAMVFSDTGTSGLNVRSLCDEQLFVASGPGIRILFGNVFNHLALLNSRYASYCIRCFTPKLTIAAGYIARIPVNEHIFTSARLSLMGERCHTIKKTICTRRPIDYGFNPYFIGNGLDECVESLIVCELNEELEKINLERLIDDEIFKIMKINKQEKRIILEELDFEVESANCTLSVDDIDECFSSVLDCNCILSKTRTSKNSLGCDGPLEYMSHKMHFSPDSIKMIITDNINSMTKTKAVYLDFIIHSKVLIELGFNTDCLKSRSVGNIVNSFDKDSDRVADWIRKRFNNIHFHSFNKKPIYCYDEHTDSIKWCASDVI